ncbi:MAG: hypothetical protein R3E50_00205 [Halioglobus sp.]
MDAHMQNGAHRVLLRTHCPWITSIASLSRACAGVTPDVADRMVSAGSTTSALCLLLRECCRAFRDRVRQHDHRTRCTSDQALQDYAGSDFRRSRSAAKNIIPNSHEASRWLGKILPQFDGRIMTWALNVPVQDGCLLDVTLVMKDETVTAEAIS